MPDVMSLDEVFEWATSEINVWEFLENVKWDILVNKPNKFVTINEIAEKLNWQFEGYIEVMHFLCLPLSRLPDIERREDTDHSLVAYMYKPAKLVDEWTKLNRQESYHSFIKKVANSFKEVKRKEELERQDVRLNQFEERQRQLIESLRNERRARRDM